MLVRTSPALFARFIFASIISTAYLAGCGSEVADTNHFNVDEEADAADRDTGIDSDADEDAGFNEAPDADSDSGIDHELDSDHDTDPPPAIRDYIVCARDLDCPINGSRCVKFASFNRPDLDGTEELAISHLFDEIEEGQGLCTQDCSDDPTICSTVSWTAPTGQSHPSVCSIVATGQAPYEVLSLDPFEVAIDEVGMQEGQAFAAICRPPFELLEGRSESFCQSCSTGVDCGDGASCYNSLTGQFRDGSDDLGTSFCVESCSENSDCPIGFTCESVGEGEDGEDAPTACLPITDTCTDCIDRDGDLVGTGNCGPIENPRSGFDCDDFNPEAFTDLDNPTHPFPDHCYDDITDSETYFNDLNCNGILEKDEQIGTEDWGEFHCAACNDACSGATAGGHRTCLTDDTTGQPYCGVGCEPGYATCSGDPSQGCPIHIATEEALGNDQPYRDGESEYIWYDAPAGAVWATSDAVPHFFCSDDEALAALDNATQKRGCHPDEPGAHPGATQTCSAIDWNCDGLAGPDDPTTTDDIGDGTVHTVGETCAVPGAFGLCAPGVAACSQDSEMSCQPTNPQYPAAIPYCTEQDTTCDGFSDYLSDVDQYRAGANDEEIILLTGSGETTVSPEDPVTVGAPCKVPGLQGQCAIGAVTCSDTGLACQQVNFPQKELPGFDDIDHSCDGFDRHIDDDGNPHVIYVDVATASTTLPEAIQLASQCDNLIIDGEQIPCDVFVQNSTNFVVDDTIELIEGVHVYGGFDVSGWDPTNGTFSAPDYGSIGSPSTRVLVNTSLGILGHQILETTHFYGIEVITHNMNDQEGCTPNIGAVCNQCDGLKLRKVTITAGAAPNGADGPAASPYPERSQPSEAGEDGDYGNRNNGCFAYGGKNTEGNHCNGYSSTPSQLLAGGHSGRSRLEGDARNGQPGWGPRGGAAGLANEFLANGSDGQNGEAFQPDFEPEDAFTFDMNSSAPYFNLQCETYDLPDKIAHFHLSAGGGGGGSGTVTHHPASNSNRNRMASGGSGGAPGALGRPGDHGAPSIAMVLVDTEANPDEAAQAIEFHNVTLTSGAGGTGGDGSNGTDGQAGAPGGETSYRYPCWFGGCYNRSDLVGGRGGDGAGGSGGNAGFGGPSIALIRINSPIGPNHPNLFAGTGGFGGIPGSGANGGGSAPDGYDGMAGEPGRNCDNFEVDSVPFTLANFDDNCVY